MHITLIEPFFGGSHEQWVRGLMKYSRHEFEVLSLPARFWKWRMYGGAVKLAERYLSETRKTDLILASDMLDLNSFLGLTRKRTANIPTAIYFHENQITYPWSPKDKDLSLKRNNQYGFINYTSALSADAVFFNSQYHKNSFLSALPSFLKQFPDYRSLDQIAKISAKSKVLKLGMDFSALARPKEIKKSDLPLILWNHRWEYDKQPGLFLKGLEALKRDQIPFQVILLGETYEKAGAEHLQLLSQFKNEIIHSGYLPKKEDYAALLWQADIMPITSIQDFFGGSIVEGMYCANFPLLPNRLAYPEHVPEAEKSNFFYEEVEDLYPMLKNCVLNIEKTRRLGERAARFVQHYSWESQIRQYDQALEELATQKSNPNLK